MKRSRDPIPRSRSSFLLVKCPDCGEERITFSCSTRNVGCRGCGRTLCESTGGQARLSGHVVKKLD